MPRYTYPNSLHELSYFLSNLILSTTGVQSAISVTFQNILLTWNAGKLLLSTVNQQKTIIIRSVESLMICCLLKEKREMVVLTEYIILVILKFAFVNVYEKYQSSMLK